MNNTLDFAVSFFRWFTLNTILTCAFRFESLHILNVNFVPNEKFSIQIYDYVLRN